MKILNYIEVIGLFYTGVQCECKGDPNNYTDIVWIGEPISQAELDQHILDQARIDKITEMSHETRIRIESGFPSSALGSEHFYDSELEDQLNLIGSVTAGTDTYYACTEVATGIKAYRFHTIAQLRVIIEDGKNVKLINLQQFNTARDNVMAATTLAEIEAVTL